MNGTICTKEMSIEYAYIEMLKLLMRPGQEERPMKIDIVDASLGAGLSFAGGAAWYFLAGKQWTLAIAGFCCVLFGWYFVRMIKWVMKVVR